MSNTNRHIIYNLLGFQSNRSLTQRKEEPYMILEEQLDAHLSIALTIHK